MWRRSRSATSAFRASRLRCRPAGTGVWHSSRMRTSSWSYSWRVSCRLEPAAENLQEGGASSEIGQPRPMRPPGRPAGYCWSAIKERLHFAFERSRPNLIQLLPSSRHSGSMTTTITRNQGRRHARSATRAAPGGGTHPRPREPVANAGLGQADRRGGCPAQARLRAVSAGGAGCQALGI